MTAAPEHDPASTPEGSGEPSAQLDAPAADAPPLDWAAVKSLFAQALEQAASQRADWMRAQPQPQAVRDEVLSLLAFEAEGSLGQATPSAQAWAEAPESAGALTPGQRLGPWEVTGPLGLGGMAEVLRARRADGAWTGDAAVKVIRPGMDSAQVLRRFAQEQRALARLVHPHIARLLDAGRTPAGQPFFVMECISGRPIDAACEGLSLEARLALFLQLADAVGFAHRQLLVHRDLKPSNVLVTDDGQVKLLDFGIAKALDPLDADADLGLTGAGPRPYTPKFASPEQIRGEPVGTATDIHGLGVLLYVMLTGQRPFGRNATTPQEAARSVLEERPTRPSSLSPPETVLDPQWLRTRRRLRGDLDNILLKALEKEPERRYASVDAMASDVRAFLGGFPVSARAASPLYLLARLAARHRVAAAALALGLAGVLGGLGASLWQAQQAERARDEARRQLADFKDLSSELVFRFGDAIRTLPGGSAAQESLLEGTRRSLEAALDRSPQDEGLKALLAAVLGRLVETQGNNMAAPERAAQAQANAARALALGREVWPQRSGDWRFAHWHLNSLRLWASGQQARGELPAAASTLREGIEAAEQALARQGADAPADAEGRAYLLAGRMNLRISLAQLLDHHRLPSLNQPDAALESYALAEQDGRELLAHTDLLEALDRAAVPGEPATAVFLNYQLGTIRGGRALLRLKHDELEAARQEAEAALVLRRQVVAAEPRNVLWRDGLVIESNTLAMVLIRLGQGPQALEAARTAWDTAQTLAREEGPRSKWAGINPVLAPQLGRALALVGQHAQALAPLELAQHAVDASRAADPANRAPNAAALARRAGWLRVLRAASLQALGRCPLALPLLEQAQSLLTPLSADPTVGRDADITRAEALAVQAGCDAAQAPALRRQALALLDAMAITRPLAPDQQALRKRLAVAN